MGNPLYLSYLPSSFVYHRSLEFMRRRAEAPEPREIAETLASRAEAPREVWETVYDSEEQAHDIVPLMNKRGIHSVDYWSPHYPSSLRALDRPPWNLFYSGKLPERVPTLAVVGTRRPDEYGARLVGRFIPRLTTRPLQIVSGLAYGIDALAHLFACECDIPNFAVLGSGIDVLYPSEHLELVDRIIARQGGILSEFPPGTPPSASNFPRRNRIISGLADIVWVVQGTLKSGSLHTAKYAAEQAKTLVACPGELFNPLSDIPNRMIFEGAQPILRPEDIDQLFGPTANTTH